MINRIKTRNYQKEVDSRLLTFFDAVLAIAITMIALEIRIPDTSSISMQQYMELFEQIITFLISFYVLGSLWFFHMEFFALPECSISRSGMLLHLVLMFLVCLFPVAANLIFISHQWQSKAIYLAVFLLMELVSAAIVYDCGSLQGMTDADQTSPVEEILEIKADEKYLEKMHLKNSSGQTRSMKGFQQADSDHSGFSSRLKENKAFSGKPKRRISRKVQYRKAEKQFYFASLAINIAAVFLSVLILMENVWLSCLPLIAAAAAIGLLSRLKIKNT